MRRAFVAAIVAIGAVRFALTTLGLPNDTVKYASMSAVILAGAIYFAVKSSSHGERLRHAYVLILPYMAVEVVALSLAWATGRETIFHAPEYSFGAGIGLHTLGHFVGGLTWEPLSVFVFMELVWGVSTVAGKIVGGRA
jgi:hypothetical protein